MGKSVRRMQNRYMGTTQRAVMMKEKPERELSSEWYEARQKEKELRRKLKKRGIK